MALTDLKISKTKPTERAQKLSDGQGLYLYVPALGGVKSWRMDYSFGGKRYTYTVGQYPTISLADARIKRGDLKKKLSDGTNPAAEKRKEKIRLRVSNSNTFSAVARKWYESKKDRRSQSWREVNDLHLRRDLEPTIGSLPIDQIDAQVMLDVIKNIGSERGIKTADRVRQTAGQVFEYAIINLLTEKNPAAILRSWEKVPAREHHPKLSGSEIPAFIDALDAYSGYTSTKLAAKLLLLTFVRKAELLQSTWSEFDLPNQLWQIPPERVKTKSLHKVPLSTQALDTLEKLRSYSQGSNYLFPKNSTIEKPMSMSTLNRMFTAIGYKDKLTPHGLRATASTWLNEHGGFRPDVIERQLAHTERNEVRAAYNHAEYIPERKKMMQAWADFLFPSSSPSASVETS